MNMMRIKRGLRWLLLIGALLAALGWWLPWVSARSGVAALVLLGLDFSDFWKFTNEWRDMGLFQVERLCFVLPPALVAMSLAVWSAGERAGLRYFLIPLLFFLSVVILPAYENVENALKNTPFVYDDPDKARQFAFQFYFALSSLLVILLIPLWQRLSDTVRRLLIGTLALAGAILPAWALWRSWLVLQGFYHGSAQLGPGLFVTSFGFMLVAISALYPLRIAQK
ncbi:MAG: hypothetical protein ACPGWR_28265 [Ardenticatenaceae bacterium]